MLWELDHRERDAEAFIRPQQAHADIVVSFRRARGDPAHLDAEVVLRDTLPHPDLSPLWTTPTTGRTSSAASASCCCGSGRHHPDHAAVLEEAVWERMSFASHLRVRQLGEFTVGTDLLRSESLALVQVILLYHLVSARAALAVGGRHDRRSRRAPRARTARCTRRRHAAVDRAPGRTENPGVETSSDVPEPGAYIPRDPGPDVERYWLPSTRAVAIKSARWARLPNYSGLAVDHATLERVADAVVDPANPPPWSPYTAEERTDELPSGVWGRSTGI